MKWDGPIRQFNLELPQDMHLAVKSAAPLRRMTMGQAYIEAMTLWLGAAKGDSPDIVNTVNSQPLTESSPSKPTKIEIESPNAPPPDSIPKQAVAEARALIVQAAEMLRRFEDSRDDVPGKTGTSRKTAGRRGKGNRGGLGERGKSPG